MTIHIVPIGLDSPERFVEGFRKFPPSKVIFLTGTKQNAIESEVKNIKDEVIRGIGKHVIIEENSAELLNFANCIQILARIISKEREGNTDEVIYINISSSTKIMTQASYMAASLFSARIYYVPVVSYLSLELIPLLNNQNDESSKKRINDFLQNKKYLSTGVKEPFEIPVLKMEPPAKDELDVLKAISGAKNAKYNSLKSLVEDGLNVKYLGSNRNKYSQVVKKLETHGFVSTNRSGREKGIKLTGSGDVIANISYILENRS